MKFNGNQLITPIQFIAKLKIDVDNLEFMNQGAAQMENLTLFMVTH